MLVSVVRANIRGLTRGAALVVLAGMAAGCSSQVARFNGVDDVFTGSTPNQRAIINGENQPYPGDAQPAAPLAATQTTSVSRGALEPVTTQPLAPPTAAPEPVSAPIARAPAPAAEPQVLAEPKPVRKIDMAAAPAKRDLDRTTTGTVEPRKTQPAGSEVAAVEEPEGWSRAGGTQVTAKEGETVYNLSRRFGVPANVIMRVNGLSEGSGLQAGQKVIIPTYVYSSKAPVSAPDSNPKVAAASSSTGLKKEQPAQKIPLPERSPQDKVAVLPQSKKLKEGEKEKPQDTASADDSNVSQPKPAEEKTARAEKGKGGGYVVQSGDTLSRIAKKNGVSVAALKGANGLKDGGLKIGQKLILPPAGETVVAQAEPVLDKVPTGSTEKPAKLAGQEAPATYTPPTKKADKTIEQAEAADDKAPDATGIGRMRWPVKGRVISTFGKNGGKTSDGIDIAVPEGTPVKAAENGVVIYAGDGLKDFGNTVLVRHENGLVTVYGNASELKVQRGQKVKRGEQIAVSGMTGNASSPKLHFEVRKNSAPVDPSHFLE